MPPQAGPETEEQRAENLGLAWSGIEVPGSSIQAALLIGCVTLNKPFDLSEPVNPHQ